MAGSYRSVLPQLWLFGPSALNSRYTPKSANNQSECRLSAAKRKSQSVCSDDRLVPRAAVRGVCARCLLSDRLIGGLGNSILRRMITRCERRRSVQPLAISLPLRQTVPMNNPWKWIALVLGAALIVLAVFTILVVNGVMDFGFSVI